MIDTQAFAPFYRIANVAASQKGTFVDSVTVAATAGGANASTGLLGPASGGSQLQIANTTLSWAYVNVGRLGDLTAATVAASYPVAPGTVVVVTVDQEVSGASVILASGAGNVIFTRGNGV